LSPSQQAVVAVPWHIDGHSHLTTGIGAAVDRVLNDPVDDPLRAPILSPSSIAQSREQRAAIRHAGAAVRRFLQQNLQQPEVGVGRGHFRFAFQ
jgi:hypothetical protein